MKRYMIVKRESLKKMLDCFSSEEEFVAFSDELSALVQEITFAGTLALRNQEDQELVTTMALKQHFVLALFCKQNIEIIHELIKAVEYTEVTEQEIGGNPDRET